MRHLLNIGALLGALILAAPVAMAFENCSSKWRLYDTSPSCYNNGPIDHRNTGRLDMSKLTFLAIRDVLENNLIQIIPKTSRLHSNIPSIWSEVTDTSMDATVFAKSDGEDSVPLEKLQPAIGVGRCDDESYHLAALFNYVTRPRDAVFVTPSQIYMFANYPEPDISKFYQNAQIDNWLPFNQRFNFVSESLGASFDALSDVEVPAWRYVNEEPGSIEDIRDRIGIGDIPWELVWELNLEDIKNPMTVEKGVELLIPARIASWKDVDYLSQSPREISNELYGEPSYERLIEYYIDAGKRQGDEKFVSLPVFEADSHIEPATVGALEGP